MSRWILAALLLLAACGGEVSAEPTPSREPNESPTPEQARPPRAARPTPATGAPWLRALLAFELRGPATDSRAIALGEQLGAPVTCPQPGTGCYVELTLAGQVSQLHLGSDETVQIWGPTEPFHMIPWVAEVERALDRSSLTAVNDPGVRPDRLWRDARHLVLLHDHSEQPCDDFCPAMLWIAAPGHPSARGYGFPRPE